MQQMLGSEVNLKPTDYCTSMWQGHLCTGKHRFGPGYHTYMRNGESYTLMGDRSCAEPLPTMELVRWQVLDIAPLLAVDPTAPEGLQFAGQLAAVGTWGLLETLAPLNADWSSWFGTIAAGLAKAAVQGRTGTFLDGITECN